MDPLLNGAQGRLLGRILFLFREYNDQHDYNWDEHKTAEATEDDEFLSAEAHRVFR